MSKSINELNFKDETIEAIGNRQVEAYYFEYLGNAFDENGLILWIS